MSLVKFTLDPNTIYVATLNPMGDNLFEITFADQGSMPNQNTLLGGFSNVNEFNGEIMTTWSGYSTLYRAFADMPTKFILSNNGSVYVEPTRDVVVKINWNDNNDEDGVRPSSVSVKATPSVGKSKNIVLNADNNWAYTFPEVPESITYTVSLDEIEGYETTINGTSITCYHAHVITPEEAQETKITEMNQIQQSLIATGTTVTLSDGTEEHFTLSDHDQTSILGLALQVASGAEKIPWHTSNHEEACKYYSNADMSKIIASSTAYITYHVTFFRDLRRYIMSLDDVETINAVQYDLAMLPEEFISEVLADIIAQMNALNS